MLKGNSCNGKELTYSSSMFTTSKLVEQIGGINLVLKKFFVNSEKIFLDTGEKLQKFLRESAYITENASQIASTISSEILQKGISDLEFSLNEISIYLAGESKKISSDKKELLNTYSKLENIGNELDGFDKIVKRLRMLGISTKIESSRLSLEDAGFFALAENVDRLSNIINNKISVIKKQSNFLLHELNKTAGELNLLEIEQRHQSEIILSKTIQSLNSFKNKSNELTGKAEEISELSQGVTLNISDIVSSIQFHDITRQQMEHSSQVLNELCMGINLDNDGQPDKYFWSSAFDVYGLQAIQLSNTLNEFVQAVETIITSLDNVGENISSILSRSFELICEKDGMHENCLKIFEDELTLISKGLMKDLEIGNQLTDSIKSIVSIVDDLSTYVTEVEEVGSEIEIIALNARIKAAHFGSNGSALGVLAESIQRLSLEAKQQTGSTANILGEIISDSQNLRTDLESKKENSSKKNIIVAVEKINKLLYSMKSVEEDTNGKIEVLKGNVNVFKNRIENAKDEITIHVEAKNSIGKIIKELSDTAELMEENFDLQSNKAENTKNIYSKYTMQSERNIHNSFAENAGYDPVVSIISKPGKAIENSFGDNVELF